MPNKIKLKEFKNNNYNELKNKDTFNEEEDSSLITSTNHDYELE